MTGSDLANAALLSYGLAAAGYGLFALRVVLGWRRSLRAALLLVAVLAMVGWAATGMLQARTSDPTLYWPAAVADALRFGAWFAFVGLLIAAPARRDAAAPGAAPPRLSTAWWSVAALVAAALAARVALAEGAPWAGQFGPGAIRARHALQLGLAIAGLVLVEQLFRRAGAPSRWSVKPLCLALAGMFGFEILFQADALLFGAIDTDIWVARGVANALLIPLIAVATARNSGWTIDMHLSRGVAFHSTALLLSGAFLLAAAAAGYYVRFFGGSWGRALQIELLFAAVLAVGLVATSGRFRSVVRVFVSKHFFSYRYDYREEWLRFTRTLAAEGSEQSIQERAVKALADLVESPAGALWQREAERGFVPVARWNMAAQSAVEPAAGSLPAFLERTGWVVDVDEARRHGERYAGLELPAWLAEVPSPWLVVPLATGAPLQGFVVLASPRAMIEVDWEVRDLLKTASRQAASYIGQFLATEALLEARKFDAFNRMSAFVVHDLKNLIAQLSLLLRNAQRHRDNPDFQRDMLSTVEHVVGRMNALLLQLRTGTTPVEQPRPVELGAVVRRVCSAKAADRVALEPAGAAPVYARGHEDRLEHVIAHLVQNALDATAERGTVALSVHSAAGQAVLEVADTGGGMTPEFVRDRLFRPFETTKPAGMGIGMYESAQYVNALGGRIEVDSAPGAGTRVRLLLPFEDSAGAAPQRESA